MERRTNLSVKKRALKAYSLRIKHLQRKEEERVLLWIAALKGALTCSSYLEIDPARVTTAEITLLGLRLTAHNICGSSKHVVVVGICRRCDTECNSEPITCLADLGMYLTEGFKPSHQHLRHCQSRR